MKTPEELASEYANKLNDGKYRLEPFASIKTFLAAMKAERDAVREWAVKYIEALERNPGAEEEAGMCSALEDLIEFLKGREEK